MYEKKLQKFFKTVFLNGQAKWDFQLDKKVDKVFWKSRSCFFFFSRVLSISEVICWWLRRNTSVALRFQLCL